MVKSNLSTPQLGTVVVIPGLLSDSRVWRSLEAALPSAKIHRADVTLDVTIADMASRILNSVEGELTVIGHSMGGRVAMEVAHQSPQRTTRLVLANTGHHPLKSGEREKRQAKIDQAYQDFAGMIREWLPPMVAASRHNDRSLMDELTQMALALSPEIHERKIKALIARPNASAYLPNIGCPILLLAGTEDAWSPIEQHQEIADLAPNAVLRIVEGAGHFLPLEQPEATASLIVDFLAQQSATNQGAD